MAYSPEHELTAMLLVDTASPLIRRVLMSTPRNGMHSIPRTRRCELDVRFYGPLSLISPVTGDSIY